MRPDLMGGMIVPLVVLVTPLQSRKLVPVQEWPRLSVVFSKMLLLSCNVGLI